MFWKLRELFSRYPQDPGVRPECLEALPFTREPHRAGSVVAFQLVADKFYFMLFAAIRARLSASGFTHADLIVVRGISGAVGTGWLAALKRSAPLAWLQTNRWVRAFGSFVDGVAYRSATWAHPLADFRDWMDAGRLWRLMREQGERPSLVIEGVEVADLVIDTYLRFKPTARYNPDDRFLRRLIWQAKRDIRQATQYFRRRKPALYLTSYSTYLEHGIPVRVALSLGVPVLSFGNFQNFGKHLSLDDVFHTPDTSRYRVNFERLDDHDRLLGVARAQVETRMSGGIDTATGYMRKSSYGKSDVTIPPDIAGSVVIFLHDFYDSPHVYKDFLFDDFWQWICFTVDALNETGASFFLKTHPNQIDLSDSVLEDLRARYPSLKWLPSSTNNVQLAKAGMVCGVTAYGTVSSELAFLGVQSIGCARHPHHAFDFCRTARDREEYREMLHSFADKPCASEEMTRQALAFYYMHNLHGGRDDVRLRDAFVEFWRRCNTGDQNEKPILHAFHQLVEAPAFCRFVDGMVCSRESSVSHHTAAA
jgi:hypothetical protein